MSEIDKLLIKPWLGCYVHETLNITACGLLYYSSIRVQSRMQFLGGGEDVYGENAKARGVRACPLEKFGF